MTGEGRRGGGGAEAVVENIRAFYRNFWPISDDLERSAGDFGRVRAELDQFGATWAKLLQLSTIESPVLDHCAEESHQCLFANSYKNWKNHREILGNEHFRLKNQ